MLPPTGQPAYLQLAPGIEGSAASQHLPPDLRRPRLLPLPGCPLVMSPAAPPAPLQGQCMVRHTKKQVLGGEEVLRLPPKTEGTVAGGAVVRLANRGGTRGLADSAPSPFCFPAVPSAACTPLCAWAKLTVTPPRTQPACRPAPPPCLPRLPLPACLPPPACSGADRERAGDVPPRPRRLCRPVPAVPGPGGGHHQQAPAADHGPAAAHAPRVQR